MDLTKKYKVTIEFPEDMPKKFTVEMEETDFYSEDDLDNIAWDYIYEALFDQFGMRVDYTPVDEEEEE